MTNLGGQRHKKIFFKEKLDQIFSRILDIWKKIFVAYLSPYNNKTLSVPS